MHGQGVIAQIDWVAVIVICQLCGVGLALWIRAHWASTRSSALVGRVCTIGGLFCGELLAVSGVIVIVWVESEVARGFIFKGPGLWLLLVGPLLLLFGTAMAFVAFLNFLRLRDRKD